MAQKNDLEILGRQGPSLPEESHAGGTQSRKAYDIPQYALKARLAGKNLIDHQLCSN